MTKKHDEKFYKLFRDECAQTLYRKKDDELDLREKQVLEEYIEDTLHPKWSKIMIDGVESNYLISNTGRVVNVSNGYELSPSLDKDGYLRVGLMHKFKQKSCIVHRLVAEAFIPNPDNKPQVNHINANKECNWYRNLEWCTQRENYDHAVRMGLEDHMGRVGEENIKARHTNDQIKKVCQLLEEGKLSIDEISERTGVERKVINRIRRNENWNEISKDYDIRYENLRYGTSNVQNVNTEEQIHHVCRLLEQGLAPTEISRQTGVSADVVGRIYHGKMWVQISSKYKFPDSGFKGENAPQSIYSNAQIKEVCEQLMNPYKTLREISESTGVKIDTVRVIYKKQQRTDISHGYNFPPRKNERHEMIIKLHEKGKSNSEIYDAITKKFGKADRRNTLCQITDAIRRHKGKS